MLSSFKGSMRKPQLQRTTMRRDGLDSMSWPWPAGVRNGLRNQTLRSALWSKTSLMTAACQIGAVYAYRGEKDRAFEWLERARRQRDSGLVALRSEPVYDNLHRDPRWNAFLHKMGLADDQLK